MSAGNAAFNCVRVVMLSRGRSPLAAGLPCGITAAEQTLLELLSLGKTYPDIASEMGLHRDTVAMRAYRIMNKLNVNTCAGAVAAAFRKGIIK